MRTQDTGMVFLVYQEESYEEVLKGSEIEIKAGNKELW